MKEGPDIARYAALIGDPARANMLTALMAGRALTATELAGEAGVTPQTASAHLARLEEAGMLRRERQGRSRYFTLAGPDVAAALEALMGLAAGRGGLRTRPGPRDAALRRARTCYDHLAGEAAVSILESLRADGRIAGEAELRLTEPGRAAFAGLGIDLASLEAGRRPLLRPCLDWSERRAHLGGALGAALLSRLLALGWARRGEGRAVTITPEGARRLGEAFPPPARAA